jgi:hypothetical protein
LSYVYAPRTIYFPTGTAAPISPAFDSSWDDTSAADRAGCVFETRTGSAFALKVATVSGVAQYKYVLLRQFVSPALPAGVIKNPDTGVMTAGLTPLYVRMKDLTSPGSNYARAVMLSRFVDGAGITRSFLGTSLTLSTDGISTASLIGRVPQQRTSWYPSGTPPTWVAGDRLVIEIGFQNSVSSVHSFTVEAEFGDASAIDITGQTDTAQHNPWGTFRFFVVGSATAGGGWTFTKPNAATILPARMASTAPVVDSDSLNELILN